MCVEHVEHAGDDTGWELHQREQHRLRGVCRRRGCCGGCGGDDTGPRVSGDTEGEGWAMAASPGGLQREHIDGGELALTLCVTNVLLPQHESRLFPSPPSARVI